LQTLLASSNALLEVSRHHGDRIERLEGARNVVLE